MGETALFNVKLIIDLNVFWNNCQEKSRENTKYVYSIPQPFRTFPTDNMKAESTPHNNNCNLVTFVLTNTSMLTYTDQMILMQLT